jgi:hypothetical protein
MIPHFAGAAVIDFRVSVYIFRLSCGSVVGFAKLTDAEIGEGEVL